MSGQTKSMEKITLKGRLNVGNAEKIYTRIKTSHDGSESLMIFLGEIQEMDLAFIQILYSLLGAAHKLGKKISVFIDDPSALLSLLERGGLESYFEINGGPQESGFRIEGKFDE